MAIFKTFSEQLRAIWRAGMGREQDPRLAQVEAADMQSRAIPTGASEKVPSDGGFLVEPEFTKAIIKRIYDTGEIIKRCTEFTTDKNGIAFPQFQETSRVTGSRLGGIQMYWMDESQDIQVIQSLFSQKPTVMNVKIQANKLTGLLYATDELMTDAFGGWAEYAFGTETAFMIEQAIVSGSGAGEPTGLLNSPALITVPKQTGQPTQTVTATNVIGMSSQLWAPSRRNAVWLYNQQLLPSLRTLTTIVGDAGSQSNLWQARQSEGDYDRLDGIPALASEYCSAPGTPGDIILADFSRYALVIREMNRMEMSIHLQYITDQDTFRAITRIGGQTIDQAVISPQFAVSTSPAFTVSPFVALATR
jgi:HK97 family phage major capsid protein